MFPYWFLLTVPLALAFIWGRLARRAESGAWFLVWVLFSLAIGLRHDVGGDWKTYIFLLNLQEGKAFSEVLSEGDPGYYLLNWVVIHLGGGIYWVNTICGMIVMAGVVRFARSLPLPWLALFVAIPYLIIVVSMGYTRQSAALGFLLLGLVSLGRSRVWGFIFWVMLGAAFHKSAVLMLPVAALASTSNRVWTWLWGGVISLLGAYLFVFDSADALWTNYVEANYQSQGALIRVIMNAVPAALFLLLRRRFELSEEEKKLWMWLALLSMVCIPLVILSSTATDRVALYLIPMQMFVFAHLPFVSCMARNRAIIVLGIISYYTMVQFVWLFFGGHAFAWLPYRTVFSL